MTILFIYRAKTSVHFAQANNGKMYAVNESYALKMGLKGHNTPGKTDLGFNIRLVVVKYLQK